MKLLFAVLLLPLVGFAQTTEQISAAFATQLRATAAQKPVYQKTVQQLDQENQPSETQTFKLLPSLDKGGVRMLSGEEVVGEFDEEFNIAKDLIATDPQLKGFFVFSQSGDTLQATRLESAQYRIDLVSQRLVYRNGKLLYLESRIERRSSFYSSDFWIEVFFTDEGKYAHHSMQFGSDLFLLGNQGTIRIEGRLLP